MKDPKKVEAGKRPVAINHKKREAKKRENGRMNQYYGIGAVIAMGVIGGLGYYIYRTKKGQVGREVPDRPAPRNPPPQQPPCPQTNKFEISSVL